MSLKENNSLSYYGTGVGRRTKRTPHVRGYALRLVDANAHCRLKKRSSYRSSRGVKVLNGKEYVLVGAIVAGGKTELFRRRAVVDDSIDDGTIDYDRLSSHIAHRQAAGRANRVARTVVDTEVQLENVQSLKQVIHAVADNPPRTVIISITGSLVEATSKQFVVDWYGGSKLTIARSRAEGEWDKLQVGQWFEATISRRMNGEVVHAMLIGTVDEPEGYSEETLAISYSSIPAAQLDSVK